MFLTKLHFCFAKHEIRLHKKWRNTMQYVIVLSNVISENDFVVVQINSTLKEL